MERTFSFNVYYRGTRLLAGDPIEARCETEARRILRRQEGVAAKAFDVEQSTA